MKLRNILDVISGGTNIIIYVGCIKIFNGKMCEVSKTEWDEKIDIYMDCEVIRINTVNGAITIAI